LAGNSFPIGRFPGEAVKALSKGGSDIPKKKKQPLTEKDLMKIEIAKELGLWEEVERSGWGALTNAQCGRIGGLLYRRMKERNM
jgi:hypothetical protein